MGRHQYVLWKWSFKDSDMETATHKALIVFLMQNPALQGPGDQEGFPCALGEDIAWVWLSQSQDYEVTAGQLHHCAYTSFVKGVSAHWGHRGGERLL